MERRSFFKALGAIAAGVGLRAVPVLGQTYSELVVPKVYAVVPSFISAPSPWGIPGSAAEIAAMWAPVTERMFADDSALRALVESRLSRAPQTTQDQMFVHNMKTMLHAYQNPQAAVYRPSAFVRITGL